MCCQGRIVLVLSLFYFTFLLFIKNSLCFYTLVTFIFLRMSLVSRVEKFHDDNRYFLPVAFIAFILMATGALYLGPVIVNSDIVVNRTLLFKSDAVILSTLLRPGWEFHAEVLANKMVSLSVINLMGETVAFSNSSSIDFKPSFLDLYFLKVHGSNYAVLDFNYFKRGLDAYPTAFLFFGSGLALLLGVFVYFFLEPWFFHLKRKLEFVDALFFPFAFMLVSIVFWVFRDSLIWFVPKSTVSIVLMIVIPSLFMLAGFFGLRRERKGKNKEFNNAVKAFLGYVIAYSALLVSVIVDYSFAGYAGLLVYFLIFALLVVVYFLTKSVVPVVIYSLTWLSSVLVKIVAYVVGAPAFFDALLVVPSVSGTVYLFLLLEFFIMLCFYFILRGYYSKTKAEAMSFGFYAGIFIQVFLQVFTGAGLL